MGNDCSKVTWRNADPNLKWNLEFKNALIEEIKAIPNFTSVTPCFMLAGPIAAGKSALVNTFLSTGKDKQIVRKALVGADGRSITAKCSRYDAVGNLRHRYRVCDTMGILESEDKGITVKDIISVMKGHIAPGYKFKDNQDIDPEDEKYIRDPAETDKSHCLVIVLSSEDLSTFSSDYEHKVKDVIRACRKEDLNPLIILTKADLICGKVETDNRKIFTCEHVKHDVLNTSKKFGLPEGYIFPVINYSSQVAKLPSYEIDIIALLALKTILESASDVLEDDESEY